ncbi:MAG: NTP transferase domain-containing protein [Actinomycetes bacterium]
MATPRLHRWAPTRRSSPSSCSVGPPRAGPSPHDARPAARHCHWTREQPVGGGPAAGLRAGLALVRSPVVVVLAADLPFVDTAAVDALRRASGHETEPSWSMNAGASRSSSARGRRPC